VSYYTLAFALQQRKKHGKTQLKTVWLALLAFVNTSHIMLVVAAVTVALTFPLSFIGDKCMA
jgi:hypothetical protein